MLTEKEIFDCLETNFRLAAEDCDTLAVSFRQSHTGPLYLRLRDELRMIEGACRQAGHWREHANWFAVGMKAAEAAERVQNFVHHKHPATAFRQLAAILRAGHAACKVLRDSRTGRTGAILPAPLAAPRENPRHQTVLLPPGMQMRSSGLMVPA